MARQAAAHSPQLVLGGCLDGLWKSRPRELFDSCRELGDKGALAERFDLGVAGKNLVSERCSGTRHAKHEDQGRMIELEF